MIKDFAFISIADIAFILLIGFLMHFNDTTTNQNIGKVIKSVKDSELKNDKIKYAITIYQTKLVFMENNYSLDSCNIEIYNQNDGYPNFRCTTIDTITQYFRSYTNQKKLELKIHRNASYLIVLCIMKKLSNQNIKNFQLTEIL